MTESTSMREKMARAVEEVAVCDTEFSVMNPEKIVYAILDVLQEPSEAAFVAADCFSTDEGAHEAKDFWRAMIAAIREGK